jgi:hypothetical protein
MLFELICQVMQIGTDTFGSIVTYLHVPTYLLPHHRRRRRLS